MDDFEDQISSYPYNTWYAVILSFAFWSGSYLAIRMVFPKTSPEYSSRILALFHGFVMTFFGLNQCFSGKSPFDNPDEPTTTDQALIIVASLGYFVEDLIWCLYYQTETALMIAHHAYSCFALSRMLFRGAAGHAATCGLGALEVTNPLLQARWFTRTHGYHNTPLFTSIEVTFMIMFFFVRIILGSIYLLLVIIQPTNTWEFRILTFLIYTMSWMFMINICKYFNHKYMEENVEAELGHMNTS
ncbi:hypothetical protein ILUMI_05546 [Ignelater luminosus]|uniref:TLC domain-containing protein n=1 Tax=Ignelater luminosus TaxID=2038154 RepID=A0A8K0DCC1_IGNLU|nr:hypothetical protein ILUMI_05546 [Ignelater luminosus]